MRRIMWGKDTRSREEKNAAARANRAAKKAETARVARIEEAFRATRWRLDEDGTEHDGTADWDFSPDQMAALLETQIGESTEFWAGPNVTITRLR